VALLGVMAYGLPATGAVATVPGLTSVTLLTVSPLTRPTVVNAVVGNTAVCPNGLDASLALTVKGIGVTVSTPSTYVTV
jgi:hypothetical protein